MDKKNEVLSNLSAIKHEKPADVIVRQLRALIESGALAPGERLPAERELAERFGVGRGHVRDALRKLDFYGVVKTLPQNGTIVAEIDADSFDRIFSTILVLEKNDIEAMMETRLVLERRVAELAAERASESAIADIIKCQEDFRAEVDAGRNGIDQDKLFHQAIARAAENSVMFSFLNAITTHLIQLNKNFRTCEKGRAQKTVVEHDTLVTAIIQHDPIAAAAAVEQHLGMTKAQFIARVADTEPVIVAPPDSLLIKTAK